MAKSASHLLGRDASSPRGLALIGQGKPLPPDFAYRGEWLHEDQIFLYRPTHEGSVEIIVTLNYGKSKIVGFNGAQLASAFHFDIERVFQHNRTGTLYLNVAEVPPSAA